MESTSISNLDYRYLSDDQIKENIQRIISENKSKDEIKNAVLSEFEYPEWLSLKVFQFKPSPSQIKTAVLMFNKKGDFIAVQAVKSQIE
jgi:hypothetical protein